MFRALLLTTSLAVATGCAAAPGGGAAPKIMLVDGQPLAVAEPSSGSAYGQFLAGKAALNEGRPDEAAGFFDRADRRLTSRNGDGEDGVVVRERAFIASLLAGEIKRAAALAPQGEGVTPAVARLGKLTVAVEDLADGKGRKAREILNVEGGIGFPHQVAASLLAPFAAAAAGDKEGALVRPQVGADRVVQVFGQLGQATLFERAGRFDEAETDFKAISAGQGGGLFAADYGAFLERRGRTADAVAVYDAALAGHPGDAALMEHRQRALSGGKPPAAPTLRQGAAQAMIAASAAAVAARQQQLATAYLRLALRLDPRKDEAWLMLGDLLSDDPAAARAAYGQIEPKSKSYGAARAKLAWSHQAAGEKDQALQMAKAAYDEAPDDRERAVTYAEILRVNEQWPQALAVLDKLIAGQGDRPDWRFLYMRGVALERLDRWDDAQRDLTAALAQQPDEPELLNYVGYSWIDRGERLNEAMAMVQKAVAANPRSGAMVDSLGWAQYRLGDYQQAVQTLERAAGLEPGDPDISNHLGDVYWRLGRRTEATYKWRAVLTLEPTEKLRAEVEHKLEHGLDPVAKTTVAKK